MFDAREHVTDLQPFPFTGLDGEQYHLPNIGDLNGHQVVRLNADDLSVIKDFDEPAYNAIMDMPVKVQRELAMAWMAHGDEAGKGQPKRSTSTSTRSKQTRSTKASTQRR